MKENERQVLRALNKALRGGKISVELSNTLYLAYDHDLEAFGDSILRSIRKTQAEIDKWKTKTKMN
jgi:hypothetical protein